MHQRGPQGPCLFIRDIYLFYIGRRFNRSSANCQETPQPTFCPHFAHNPCQPQAGRPNAKAGPKEEEIPVATVSRMRQALARHVTVRSLLGHVLFRLGSRYDSHCLKTYKTASAHILPTRPYYVAIPNDVRKTRRRRRVTARQEVSVQVNGNLDVRVPQPL